MDVKRTAAVLVAILLWLSACGSGQESSTTIEAGDPGAAHGMAADESIGDPPIASATEVHRAIVHVEAWGLASPPGSVGASLFIRQGSGFVVDPSGLAVTAGHLVNAASRIDVYVVPGEPPVLGRVIGVDECSDLAVIAFETEDHPYLRWFDGEVEEGLEVFVAGYPNGDPEYTLGEGEILAVWPFGDYAWASVDSTVQHTATTSVGSSGGAVVTEHGEVVAVAIAFEPGEVPAYFATTVSVAQTVTDDLLRGVDGASIGAEIFAWAPDGAGPAGAWVKAVVAQSPAAAVGLEPGDIISQVGGVSLGEDRTLETFCQVLRAAEVATPIPIDVVRPATGELLRGELHGQPLAFVDEIEQAVEFSRSPGLLVTYDGYERTITDFVEVTDDSGALATEVPRAWMTVDGRPLTNAEGETVGFSLAAAAAASASTEDAEPSRGPDIEISAVAAQPSELDALLRQNATDVGVEGTCSGVRHPFDDGTHHGVVEIWTNCSGTDANWVVMGLLLPEDDLVVVVNAPIETPGDLESLDRAIGSLRISR